ncbi:MAG: histidine phosphatase family protein [Steroidobacteraceae bacterium]
MRLIAIRHGETEWNIEGREQGHLDSALTPRGIQQSRAVAERLRRGRFSVLYSSDLGRAMQTAEIISSVTGIRIMRDVRLRERNMGIFEGLTKEEIAQNFPAEYSDYRRIGHGFRIPKGESGQERLERSIRVLNAIAERHPTETIVAVTHGGFLMGFFEHMLGVAPGNGWRFRRQHAAYNSFEYVDGVWKLETWNETAHLDQIGSIEDPTVQAIAG